MRLLRRFLIETKKQRRSRERRKLPKQKLEQRSWLKILLSLSHQLLKVKEARLSHLNLLIKLPQPQLKSLLLKKKTKKLKRKKTRRKNFPMINLQFLWLTNK